MKRRAKIIFFLAIIICVFASCSSKTRSSAITSMLDEADRCIEQNHPSDALKFLNEAQKKIVSPMEAIGIYRRYILISERKSAEKVILKNLKKHPNNLELNAIYTDFLKSEGRYEKAFAQSKILKGTKYGSLYSELYMRNLLNDKTDRNFDFYLSNDFEPIYKSAYDTSLDNAWLRNVALMHLARGEYGVASALAPEKIKSLPDAYFWSMVFYDAQKYDYAVQYLLEGEKILKETQVVFTENIPDIVPIRGIEIASLLSDCYVNVGEYDEAENVRGDLIAQIMLSEDENNSILLGNMYLNSALYNQERDNLKAAYNYLSLVVEKWPDLVPALIAYGNFAYDSTRRVLDDPLTRALRDAGVVSSEMKRFDELPRVSVSDALARMKESHARTKNETLHVAILDLEDRVDTRSDERVRLSKVWLLLEQNTISANLYPQGIMQYALHILLMLEKYDDAKTLFVKYLNARFGFDQNRAFEEEILNNMPQMDLWEIEYAAYFVASENDSLLAKRLYERAVYGNEDSSLRGSTEIAPECSVQSVVNLAMIYSSTGNKDGALKLYGAAGSRATDGYLKSEIFYRLGCIHNAKGNKEEARRHLEYSLYLNPGNGNARLLLNN